ncbi:NAD-P-binding protein [Mycena amicta]|nr:NAD-P-binding protein [Mycena amicta]
MFMSSLPVFSAATTAEEVADALSNWIQGKNVLVTGTSLNGIGYETARAIAKHANLVVITGYNQERLKRSATAITTSVPTANIRCLDLDLSSLAAVRKAAAEVNTYPEPLHILIHNAARPMCQFQLTTDNRESQIATGHVGPFLFTKLLLPKLLASRASADSDSSDFAPRVVFVSSIAHSLGAGTGVDFSTLVHPDPVRYNAGDAYAQTKSANILSAIELSRRSQGRIKSYSLCPGLIHTNMIDHPTALPELHADGKPDTTKLEWKTLEQGAATTLVAAFDPRIADQPGSYLDDCILANESVAPHSSDPANAKKLWELTESIIGEEFIV